jgi:hypothetical protein
VYDTGPKHSTSNLRNHMCTKHKKHWDPILEQEAVAKRAKELKSKSATMERFAIVNPEFPSALLKWIVFTYQTLEAGVNKHFREMIYSVSKNTRAVGKDAIRVELFQKERLMQSIVKKMLQNKHVSISMDFWKSTANIDFCGVTLHWINSDWELQCLKVDVVQMSGVHSADRIMRS